MQVKPTLTLRCHPEPAEPRGWLGGGRGRARRRIPRDSPCRHAHAQMKTGILIAIHGSRLSATLAVPPTRKLRVHMENYLQISDAIAREKQIKGWSRARKNALVESTNPRWQDLAATWYACSAFSSSRWRRPPLFSRMKTGDSSSRSTAHALSPTPAVPPIRNDSAKLKQGPIAAQVQAIGRNGGKNQKVR